MRANINVRQIILKHGNNTVAGNYVGPIGEVVLDTDLQTIRVQDGTTLGGIIVPTQANAQSYANLAIANSGFGNILSNIQSGISTITGFDANTIAEINTLIGNLSNQGNIIANIQSSITGNTIVNANLSLLNPGDMYFTQTADTVSMGQFAAQNVTLGPSGIQIAGTGGVQIMGAAGAAVDLGGGSSGSIVFNSPTSGINYNDLTNKPTITSYGNANVASYLIDNPQNGLYSNANVASYLLSDVTVGNLSLDGNVNYKVSGLGASGAFGINSWYPVNLTVNDDANLPFKTWAFGTNGTTTIPGPIVTQYGNIEYGTIGPGITLMSNVDAGQYFNGLFVGNTDNREQHYVYVDPGQVVVGVTNTGTNQTYQWTFNDDASLNMPGGLNLAGNINFTASPAGAITGASLVSAQEFYSSGNVTIGGNLVINGNATTVGTRNLIIDDNIIYLANANPANSLDIGFAGHFTSGTYQHTGLVRQASTGQWKLFSNIAAEPSNTLDFSTAVYDDIQVGNITSPTITNLYSNAAAQANSIAGANAAIVTANTAMKSYVDAVSTAWTSNAASQAGLITTLTSNAGVQADAITTLTTNAAVQSANIATLVANAGVQADAITSLTANAGVQSANIATLFSNAGVQADAITSLQANITAANLAIAAAIGTYSNTNVAAYLSASTTGNVGAGNLTVINNFNSNIISANSFTYANGVSILAGIVGTYSNTNVSVYLSSQNITGANIGGLYNSITGANTVIQTLSANVGGFYTWANANFGTSSYSNANVASYLVANPQGGNYSNVNVAAYIAGNLSTINANITGANAAIVTANSAVVSYVNTLNTAMSSNVAGANAAIVTANTAMKVYVDAGNTTMTSYVGNQVTTANTALKGYVDAGNTTMTSYVGNQVTTANTAMKSYVDAGNTTQSNQINSINANIGSYYTWANANVAGLSGQITGANAVISALQANVGSYYTWANANVATQQTSINSLATGANTNTAAYLAAGISTNVTTTGNVSAGNVFVNGQPTTYGTVNPAYMVVGLASSVSGFGSGSTVIFDTVVGNTNSQTSYNASTGVFTLTAGVTYDMSFTPSFITFTNSTTGYLCYQWVDATTNTPLDSTGTGIGTGISSQDTTAQQDNLTARVIYTPSTNQTVKLLVTSGNGTAVLRGSIGTQAVIKPLNPTIAVQATATGTVSATVVANTSPNTTTTTGGSSTLPALTVLTVAIPGAGTWRLDAELRVYIPGAGYMAAAFYNNGTLIPGSEYFVAAGGVTQTGAATGQYSGFMSYNLTTTGATTVTMGFWSTTSSQFISSGDGRTWLQATQIDSIFALNTLATMSVTGNVTAGNIISNGNIAMVSNIARNVYVNSYAPSSTQGNVGDIWYQTF